MKTAGIVAEYNPFHNGHRLHIEKTREMLGGDTAIVCVMSGNFIQRGEPAILAKHVRAKAAVLGGADLVLELPLPYVLSSAERFAFGAAGLLASLGCVDYISFGCESGSAAELTAAVEMLLQPEFGEVLRGEMRSGVSFAAARQSALERISGRSMALLARPNNILAVEYIKALRQLASPIEPLAVARRGAGHDEPKACGRICSASAIRAGILAGEDMGKYMPLESAALLASELEKGSAPVTAQCLEQSVLTRLRMMAPEEFAGLPDMSEGLHLRLMRAARSCGSLEELYSAVKTKRYALSRIRRAVMCAWLGIAAEDSNGRPPYARVLAANEKGCALLRQAKKHTVIITKPTEARKMEGRGRRLFELEARATDFRALGAPSAEQRRGGTEWEISPVILASKTGGYNISRRCEWKDE